MISIKSTLVVFVLFLSFTSQTADAFQKWTQLNYDTPSECFQTGIKRVFVPFPGFGTIGCFKDSIKQLPNYENSFQLLAGHAVGLVATALAATVLLIIGEKLKIPGCKTILGPEFANLFKIKLVKLNPDPCK